MDVYASDPWASWYVGAAGDVSGILQSQNPIEAFHRVSKRAVVGSLGANTATVLNSSLPGILKMAGMEQADTPLCHYGEVSNYHFDCIRPIPIDFFARARELLADTKNYMRMRRPNTRDVRAVVFYAADFVTTAAKPHEGVSVTAARVKRVAASLQRRLVPGKPVTGAPLLYMSVNTVTVKGNTASEFVNRPTWRSQQVAHNDIEELFRAYTCDCKPHRHTGWICKHVLAAMSILAKMNLDDALRALPVRRLPGRQPKARSALVRDPRDDLKQISFAS
ncbi:hypothetical protein V7S43_018303 [Phytophthora oleae]|uniref:SWIM-type domain-containing protein n=1 Tax=Phytophthora oleae TaxID=2107226 RepID=A0ABD3ERD4_9STRA